MFICANLVWTVSVVYHALPFAMNIYLFPVVCIVQYSINSAGSYCYFASHPSMSGIITYFSVCSFHDHIKCRSKKNQPRMTSSQFMRVYYYYRRGVQCDALQTYTIAQMFFWYFSMSDMLSSILMLFSISIGLLGAHTRIWIFITSVLVDFKMC